MMVCDPFARVVDRGLDQELVTAIEIRDIEETFDKKGKRRSLE